MKLRNWIVVLAALGGLFISQDSWATCSNYATYADGQVLTAASLNSLQTNYTNCVNNVLDGDNFTGNMNWYSGSDITMYSDAGTTPTFTIEGSGGNITLVNSIGGALSAGQFSNCGMTYASDTLSITDEAGAALAATNPCCIGVPGATAGQNGTICFTAPVSSTFAAASDTDGNTFGITAAVNWANDMPFFLYACRGSASNYFAFSRQPNKTVTGAAAADLCQEGDTDCGTQSDLFIMTSGLTLASETAKPCQVVGSFTAQWDTTNDHWDVTALDAADGFGMFQEGVSFTFPKLQNGATLNYLSIAGSATTLAFETGLASTTLYSIFKNGMVEVSIASGTRSAGDATATQVWWHIPYTSTRAGMVVCGFTKIGNVAGIYPLAVVNGASYILTSGYLASNYTSANDYYLGGSALGATILYKAY